MKKHSQRFANMKSIRDIKNHLEIEYCDRSDENIRKL